MAALTKSREWTRLLSLAARTHDVSRRASLCTRRAGSRDDGDLRDAVLEFEDSLPHARAVNLPPSWYTQRSMHSLEMSAVYNARWVGVGSVQRVSSAGSYFTGTMGHEPYLIVNDGVSINAFYNICPHRGSLLVRSAFGTASSFACANRGRVYALDGSLLSKTPLDASDAETSSVEARESSERLGRAAIATFGPAVLVHLQQPGVAGCTSGSPAEPNNRATSKLPTFTLLQTAEFQASSNWKLIVEKYLQHMGAPSDQRRHRESYFPDRRSTKPPTSEGADSAKQSGNYSTYIYPNVFIERSREGVVARYVTPLDFNLCAVTVDYFALFPSGSSSEDEKPEVGRELAGKDQVETRECLRECEDMQKSMLSKRAQTLRSCSAVDAKTHEFHVTLAEDLKEALQLKFDITI